MQSEGCSKEIYVKKYMSRMFETVKFMGKKPGKQKTKKPWRL